MEVIRNRPRSEPGPATRFDGSVWMERLAAAPAPSHVQVLAVHFAPGARTAWHRHPAGQVLVVLEGEGRVQRRGGAVEAIQAGDAVETSADEWHWHGAGPATFMTHLAIQEAGDGVGETEWGERVDETEYGAEPRT